ncbi:MAG: hypothetical protein P8M25_03580 [Paracoccaceae bacterium]|nr:hypothetical protein [Paracoccaceae bacterium]
MAFKFIKKCREWGFLVIFCDPYAGTDAKFETAYMTIIVRGPASRILSAVILDVGLERKIIAAV